MAQLVQVRWRERVPIPDGRVTRSQHAFHERQEVSGFGATALQALHLPLAPCVCGGLYGITDRAVESLLSLVIHARGRAFNQSSSANRNRVWRSMASGTNS